MKLFLKAVCCGVILTWAGQASAPAGAFGPGEVVTRFTILVGFPSKDQPASEAPILVPGTVIPVGPESGRGNEAAKTSMVDKSLSFTRGVDKLWATFRLDPERRTQNSITILMSPGKPFDLPAIENAGVRISTSLAAFDGKVATFRVVFRQGAKVLADSTVNVALAEWAVVGGMDGDLAPYVFLILEPQKAGMGEASVGMTAPEILDRVLPKYPEGARKERIMGTVIVEVLIDEKGRVKDASVLTSPDDRLGQAALEAVRLWTFRPARKMDGSAVEVRSSISIEFKLR